MNGAISEQDVDFAYMLCEFERGLDGWVVGACEYLEASGVDGGMGEQE